MQKILIVTGVFLLTVGLLWPLIKKSPLGRLPGDIHIEGDGYSIQFPLVTCLILSLILSLLLYLFKK